MEKLCSAVKIILIYGVEMSCLQTSVFCWKTQTVISMLYFYYYLLLISGMAWYNFFMSDTANWGTLCQAQDSAVTVIELHLKRCPYILKFVHPWLSGVLALYSVYPRSKTFKKFFKIRAFHNTDGPHILSNRIDISFCNIIFGFGW